MPLVILGIIVVVGAGLMIYYQIGPTLRGRAGNAGSASAARSRKQKTFAGYTVLDSNHESAGDLKSAANPDGTDREKFYEKSDDGKVLYVRGGGKTEIRPLREEDEKE